MRPAEAGPALYPERADEEPSAADRFFLDLWGRAAARAAQIAARFGVGAVSRLRRRAQGIETIGVGLRDLPDSALKEKADRLGAALRREGFAQSLIDETLALVRECAGRTLGLRPYEVQMMGALALLEGRLAEMQTGEGKTLTAAVAGATAALGGWPTHIVTVNDYLAERDATEMAPLYRALGLSVGFIRQDKKPPERRDAYACDVTYAVNKEIAFDYQRDRLAMGRARSRAAAMAGRLARPDSAAPELLLRGLSFAIIDEADSIMIDEARTPLVIAGAGDLEDEALARGALSIADQLEPEADFTLHAAARSARLTENGQRKVGLLAKGRGGVWEARRGREELVTLGLAARRLHERDRDYVVRDDKIEIVDPFTGRVADGRQWQNGLHQIIEAKENVTVTARSSTRSSITYQRFFRRYLHLAGMSGTLAETIGELRSVYGLRVARIPTHRPSLRIHQQPLLLGDQMEKHKAVARAAAEIQARGRAVLIGAGSVAESEKISALLAERGVAHTLLNARNDRDEAQIVAEAGQAGRITVATSMAGRGTDIKLATDTRAAGGLHVILANYAESSRVDRQLFGRAGRQGDPASAQAIVALDDPTFALFAPKAARAARALMKFPPIPRSYLAWLLRAAAQKTAQRDAARQRRDTINAQRLLVKNLGFAHKE